MNNVFGTIAQIIADTKGIDTDAITLDSTLEGLNIDSLDVAEMCMTLEDEFGVSIEQQSGIETVRDLVNLINERIAA